MAEDQSDVDDSILDYGHLDQSEPDVSGTGSRLETDSPSASDTRVMLVEGTGVQTETSPSTAEPISTSLVDGQGVETTSYTPSASGARVKLASQGRTVAVKSTPSTGEDLRVREPNGTGVTTASSPGTAGDTRVHMVGGTGVTTYFSSSSEEAEQRFQEDSIAGVAQANDTVLERLPYPTPKRTVRVEREPYQYNAVKYDDGTESEQTKYVLRKAPIDEVLVVRAEIDGHEMQLTEGVDYEVVDTNGDLEPDSIDFETDDGLTPDYGSTFYVNYEAQSVLSRKTNSVQEEIDQTLGTVNRTVNSSQITNAQEDQLDEIGKEIADIGVRRDRNDIEYRTYLKSLSRAFKGRGTKNGVKYAISTATIGGIENISIEEDFVQSKYSVHLQNWTPHQTKTIDGLAELADPSGVERLPPIHYDNPDTAFRIFSAPSRSTGISLELPPSTITIDARPAEVDRYTDGLGSGYLGDGELSIEDDMSLLTFDADELDTNRVG